VLSGGLFCASPVTTKNRIGQHSAKSSVQCNEGKRLKPDRRHFSAQKKSEGTTYFCSGAGQSSEEK